MPSAGSPVEGIFVAGPLSSPVTVPCPVAGVNGLRRMSRHINRFVRL